MPIFDPGTLSPLAWFQSHLTMFKDTAGTIPCTADNDAVKNWPENTGVLGPATEATNFPTFQTNQTPNGKPCVRFDGAASVLNFGGVGYFPASFTFTMYAYVKIPSTGIYGIIGGANNSFEWRINNKRQQDVKTFASLEAAGATDVVPGTWTQVSVSFDSATKTHRFRTNLVNETPASITGANAFANNMLYMGASKGGGSFNDFFANDLACYLLFSTVHSDANKDNVQSWITATYTTVTAGSPLARAPMIVKAENAFRQLY